MPRCAHFLNILNSAATEELDDFTWSNQHNRFLSHIILIISEIKGSSHLKLIHMEPFGSIPSGSLDQDRKFLLLEQRLNDKKLKEKFTETNKTPGGRSSSGSSKENSYGKEINVPPAINSVQNAVALENVHSMSNHQVINNNSSTAAQVAETVELTKECSSGNENSKLIHKRKNENFSPGNKNSKLITIEDSNQGTDKNIYVKQIITIFFLTPTFITQMLDQKVVSGLVLRVLQQQICFHYITTSGDLHQLLTTWKQTNRQINWPTSLQN